MSLPTIRVVGSLSKLTGSANVVLGNGSASAPAYAFASSSNAGMYLVSGNTVGISGNGAQIASFAPGGLTVSGTVTAGNVAGNKGVFAGHEISRGANVSIETNLAVGNAVLSNVSSGSENTAIGYTALGKTTTGYHNVAIGAYALNQNTTGYFNNGIGRSALNNNTTGNTNVSLGWASMFMGTTGSENTAIGHQTLYNNNGDKNTAVGLNAMYTNTTGIQNTAIGERALITNSTGNYNSAHGSIALRDNSTGSFNSAFGHNALPTNTSGNNNCAFGVSTLGFNTTGAGNSAFGFNSLYYNNNTNNSALGNGSLFYTIAGGGHAYDGCSGIGTDSRASGANQICLGSSATTTYAYGAVQNRSDARDKTDVRDTVLGLKFIEKLRAVDYRWDMRDDYYDKASIIGMLRPTADLPQNAADGVYDIFLDTTKIAELTLPSGAITIVSMSIPAPPAESILTCPAFPDLTFAVDTVDGMVPVAKDGSRVRGRYHHGLVAQEVQAVMEDMGTDFGGFQWHGHNGGDDVYSIGYEELIGPLIKSVQELSGQLQEVRAELAALKA